MSQLIGGRLTTGALAALAGDTDEARMRAFRLLTREQQAQAIRRLHLTGMGDSSIAAATQLSVEFVRRVLESAP